MNKQAGLQDKLVAAVRHVASGAGKAVRYGGNAVEGAGSHVADVSAKLLGMSPHESAGELVQGPFRTLASRIKSEGLGSALSSSPDQVGRAAVVAAPPALLAAHAGRKMLEKQNAYQEGFQAALKARGAEKLAQTAPPAAATPAPADPRATINPRLQREKTKLINGDNNPLEGQPVKTHWMGGKYLPDYSETETTFRGIGAPFHRAFDWVTTLGDEHEMGHRERTRLLQQRHQTVDSEFGRQNAERSAAGQPLLNYRNYLVQNGMPDPMVARTQASTPELVRQYPGMGGAGMVGTPMTLDSYGVQVPIDGMAMGGAGALGNPYDRPQVREPDYRGLTPPLLPDVRQPTGAIPTTPR